MNGNSKIILAVLIPLFVGLISWGGYEIVSQGRELSNCIIRINGHDGIIKDTNSRVLTKLESIGEDVSRLRTDVEVLKNDNRNMRRESWRDRNDGQ